MTNAKTPESCSTRRKKVCFIVSLSLLFFANNTQAISVKACFNEAKSALEKAYCEILEKGKTLPEFYDFQRNPPTTQRLLLKAPARKAGITLPEEAPKETAPKPQPEAPSVHQHVTAPERPASEGPSAAKTGSAPSPNDALALPEDEDELANCKLDKQEITCPQQRFFLVVNVPLDRLSPRVLDEDNRLEFPAQPEKQSDIKYLSHIYPGYIEKMLLIGLGDSTMSFTKFAALHTQAKDQPESFSTRFSDMYELLKNERKSMGVKTRYQENYPQSLEFCMRLNNTLIACDDINQNWVYQQLQK